MKFSDFDIEKIISNKSIEIGQKVADENTSNKPIVVATCGFSANCSGGGGECGFSANCSGGGGVCGFSADCAGGGGKCGLSADCAGS